MNERQEKHLDNLIDEIVKATSASQNEINSVAETPFLYRRIRARLEEENKDKSILSLWSDLFRTFKLATQATAIIALIAVAVFLLQPSKSQSLKDNAISASPLLDEVVFSNDDMFEDAVGLSNSNKVLNEVKK